VGIGCVKSRKDNSDRMSYFSMNIVIKIINILYTGKISRTE
jgi:hypothetical protein